MKTITKENEKKDSPLLKPEVKIIAERCAGCQECVIRCPTQAISMDAARWIAVANNDLCVGCRQCERTCPFTAISVEGPLVVTEPANLPPYSGPVAIGDIREVRPGFGTLEQAIDEAKRCLNCPDPTCVRGCPAHNDIAGFIEAIRNDNLIGAQKIISETSCLPDICSRVCNWEKQCEGACNWALSGGEPVAIGKLERFVTDNNPAIQIRPVSERGKGLSVGIIGSGPAGIAAAWELASAKASVTIYEREKVPGGVIQWGIPLYVLPDKVTQRPINALVNAGVKFSMNTEITPEVMKGLLDKHDAVIAAFGAAIPERPNIPGEDLEGVTDATTFLTRARKALVDGAALPELRNARVLVLGGSNTAIDVARSVLRLGGKPIIIHREEEPFSYGRQDEIAEAKNEGIEFRFATNVSRLEGEGGKVKRAILVRTSQKRVDKIPAAIKGTEQVLDIDMVVIAIGYRLDPTFSSLFSKLPARQPVSERLFSDRRWLASGIMAGNNPAGKLAWEREYGLRLSMHPRLDKLWLIGDALTGPSTVVGSMAQGRLAARGILEKRPGGVSLSR